MFIDGLVSLLNEEPDMVIEDVANDGKQLLYLLEKQKPDMVLLDINMPGINGLEVLRYIKLSWPFFPPRISSALTKKTVLSGTAFSNYHHPAGFLSGNQEYY